MGQIKDKLVATFKDINGNIIFVCECKNVTHAEYLALKDKSVRNYQNVLLESEKKAKDIEMLKLEIKLLKGEISQEEYEKEIKLYE